MKDCKIMMAAEEQAEEVADIYRTLVGSPGCTWNENYPTIEDVKEDIRKKSLYIVCADGKIVAAAAAGKDDELEQLTCWNTEIKRFCDLARIGVLQSYQGRGTAKELIRKIEKDMAVQGFDGIRFLVGKRNARALALYERMAYQRCGEAHMYGMDWDCYEKKLNSPDAGTGD